MSFTTFAVHSKFAFALSTPLINSFRISHHSLRPLCSRSLVMTSPQAAPATTATPVKLPAKRLCIFSDGSWNSPDLEVNTNVSLLAQSVEYQGPSGVPQVVFYDQGVGTEGNQVDKVMGGATGLGIDLNIKQLYTFLVMNYTEGDEIYLFGFSRGAYTVRSLTGMIYEAGLLYRDKLELVSDAYKLYRENVDINSDEAVKFREENARRVPIKLISCFDTVGALGIPNYIPFPLNLFSNMDNYKFHNTTLSENIENAIHVVSIEEELVPFEPTLMTANPKVGDKQLTQVYMCGRHGGVGGGNKDDEFHSLNALKFVIDEMKRRGLKLDVNETGIPKEYYSDGLPKGQPDLVSLFGLIGLTMGKRPRTIASSDLLHPIVFEMYKKHKNWRPASLKPFEDELLQG